MSQKLSDTNFDSKQEAVYDVTGTGTNLVDWKIPSTERDKLTIPKGEWETAFAEGGEANKLHRSKLQVETKDIKRGIYEPIVNDFVAGWIKSNPLIPDEKKLEMHIHVDSGSRSHSVAPTTFPVDTKIDSSVPGKITTSFKDSVSGGTGKPEGVLRIESWVFISQPVIVNGAITYTAPESEDDYIHWGNDSSDMKATNAFKMADFGKSVYMMHRYANNVGHGPFGRPVVTVIPK